MHRGAVVCADDEASLARSTHDGGCTAGKSRGSIAAQAAGEEKIIDTKTLIHPMSWMDQRFRKNG